MGLEVNILRCHWDESEVPGGMTWDSGLMKWGRCGCECPQDRMTKVLKMFSKAKEHTELSSHNLATVSG